MLIFGIFCYPNVYIILFVLKTNKTLEFTYFWDSIPIKYTIWVLWELSKPQYKYYMITNKKILHYIYTY